MQNNQQTTESIKEDVDIRQAEVLIEELEQARNTFREKTAAHVKAMEGRTDEAEREARAVKRELEKLEQEIINDFDEAMNSFLGREKNE